MANNPCFGCDSRCVGCHSTCDSYKDWKSGHDAEKENDRQRRITEYTFRSYKVDTCKKTKKRRESGKE